MKQKKFMIMKRPQDRDDFVSHRVDSDLWLKIPFLDTETGQRQNFNEYELLQDEYLRNLEMTDNIEQTYPQDKLGNNENGQMSQLFRKTRNDNMKKLRIVRTRYAKGENKTQ